jgi:FAD/FMN-containing dehydrogenase
MMADTMAPGIERIAEIVGPDGLVTSESERAFYAHDVFRAGATPLAVVRPASVDELQAVVRAAYETGTAIITRGGGASYTDAYAHSHEGGITIDTSRLDRIEIDEVNATVTVEPGVTWEKLRAAVLAKGFKTRFWGSYSGLFATVAGSMSMNAISHGQGSAADAVLSFDIITGTGEMIRTGSALSGPATAFWRHYGPDLTGIFTSDCGAMGIKARITLALEVTPPAFATASFAFAEFADLHAAFRAAALSGLVEENFGLNAVLQQGQLGKADTAAKMEMAGKVVKQSGMLKGAAKLARMALAGDKEIAEAPFAGHFIVEGLDQADATRKIAEVRRLCAEYGAEIPNSVPEVVRAMPFAPFHNVLGPKGERWVPCHAKLPHSAAPAFHDALVTLVAEEAAVMEQHGIVIGGMFMAVGSTAFVYEPAFYWPDARNVFHRRMVDPSHLASLPEYPASAVAEAEVLRIKQRVVDLMHDHGGVHSQIGRAYPYARDHDPGHWALLKAIKAELDPKGILNPGVLGL